MRTIIYLILTILMTLLIWANSVLPADVSGAQSGFIVNFVQTIFRVVNINIDIDILSLIIRKSAHFIEFFILGLLWYQLLLNTKMNRKSIQWYVILFCLITAIIDESIQLFSEGRAFQIFDIGIDLFGSTMGMLSLLFTNFINKTKGESA